MNGYMGLGVMDIGSERYMKRGITPKIENQRKYRIEHDMETEYDCRGL